MDLFSAALLMPVVVKASIKINPNLTAVVIKFNYHTKMGWKSGWEKPIPANGGFGAVSCVKSPMNCFCNMSRNGYSDKQFCPPACLVVTLQSANMKKLVTILSVFLLLILVAQPLMAQCSICTKTASQLGPQAAKGLNSAIIYLMVTPFLIGGLIGYRWWKNNREAE